MVEVDLSGIQEVGQGFVDELFRVWQGAHRGTRLVAINANPAVQAMMSLTAPGTEIR